MGGALFLRGVIVRMSPDSACTKNTMANIVASQKIDRTAALDLFILLFVLLRANVPSPRSSTETSPSTLTEVKALQERQGGTVLQGATIGGGLGGP